MNLVKEYTGEAEFTADEIHEAIMSSRDIVFKIRTAIRCILSASDQELEMLKALLPHTQEAVWIAQWKKQILQERE